jgi:hypothetical protein
MKAVISLIVYILTIYSYKPIEINGNILLEGSWKSDSGVIILTENCFSYAEFDMAGNSFEGTYGGTWELSGIEIIQNLEYNTYDKSMVGKKTSKKFTLSEGMLIIDSEKFIKIDDGSPGKLTGGWLFAGRKRDGELTIRNTDQPRKTMKILSGMRFQWIAYNSETGDFFGTGGGTYSTIGNRYTENIEFFSRDSSRVGASLTFNFEIIDGIWHHQGLNSRGEPLYEIWSLRK